MGQLLYILAYIFYLDMNNQVLLLNDNQYIMPIDEDDELQNEEIIGVTSKIGIQDLIYWSFQVTSGMNHLASKKV